MDERIEQRLADLILERQTLDKEIMARNQEIAGKSVELIKDAMKNRGLDELIIIPCDADGNQLAGWDCDEDFEFDEADIVEFDNDEIRVGDIEENGDEISYNVITRFGIKEDTVVFHTASASICTMGDLSFGGIDQDCYDDEWLPISDFTNALQLHQLIVKCLSPENEGIWRFAEAHPECRFLHRRDDKNP